MAGQSSPLRKTPLADIHRRESARMVPFAGWQMPLQYDSILAEHVRTRTAVSLFDTCHMGIFDLRGARAAEDLDRLLTCAVAPMEEGRCRYGYLLDEQGGVIDDLTCYRLAADRFRLVVNAGTTADDAAWIREHLSPETGFEDVSGRLAKLDVQGPDAPAAIARAFGTPPPSLRFFRAADAMLGDLPCLVSRTGYTGELGYELYFDAARVVEVWQRLRTAGAAPAGLGARDTLRLEMGYPLYGHELTRERTPAGVADGAFIARNKPFIGRDAVARELAAGPLERLVGLRLAGRRAARPGDAVRHGERAVGAVTSGGFAPSLGYAVAMAWIEADQAAPGTPLAIAARGATLDATVTPLPFYRRVAQFL